ncbi:MAG: sulfatase-like hydrolase/transferase, partial [Planctomycetota bacterium]
MTLTRRQFLRSTLIGSVPVLYGSAIPCRSVLSQPRPKRRPNIVLVMADDMGFSDAGCYGGEIHTPNIDRLAANGLRFTQFYNCARCCPTRASLMTGQYPHKVGLARNGQSLTRNGLTIAETLGQAGYNTAMAGKWHLSSTTPLADKKLHQKWLDHQHNPGQPFARLQTYPVNRGFDNHYGVVWGVIDYFDPFSLVEGEQAIREVPEDYY